MTARHKLDTRMWRGAGLSGAEFLRGRFSDYAYDPHTHDKACFALITRGAIRIRMRGGEFVARAGDLYAIDAEEPHAGWPVDDAGWSLRTLYVDMARLQEIIDDSRAVPALAGPIIRERALTAAFRVVHAGSESGEPLAADEHCAAFAARLFARHVHAAPPRPAPAREERAVRRACEFLDHRVDRRVRLADIAAAAGLPPFRLFRAFEKTTGLTPHGYQRQARLRLAARLIRSGEALGEAAAACGFSDQAHLTRSFRRTMGVTPGAYQAVYRGAVRCGGAV